MDGALKGLQSKVEISSNGSQGRPDGAIVRFFARPDIRANLAFLKERLPPAAQIVVAGGALRNIIIAALHGSAPPTPDIDIFIGGLDRGFPLSRALHDQRTRPTDLKGIRWHPVAGDLAYDLCLLPDFVVIDTYHLDPTPANLLDGIDFTVNAIVYDLKRRTVVEKGCTPAIRARLIDFNSRRIPDKSLIAYRVLLLGHKTGFTVAAPVFDFLRNRLGLEALRQVKGLLKAKAGKDAATLIMRDYDALCRHPSYEAYRADHPGPR